VHSGDYVKFRKRRHGASSAGTPGNKFVVFNQNHDQVGNRPLGERLCMLVDFERQKLAAAAVLLAPYVPMLLMGEEYADRSPFFYFVSHSDESLISAVREGRRKEFAAFSNADKMPDAQDEDTFLRSKLQWEKRKEGAHQVMWHWHRRLIQLRQTEAALRSFNKNDVQAYPLAEDGLVLIRQSEDGLRQLAIYFNFSEKDLSCYLPGKDIVWQLVLHSKEQQWMHELTQAKIRVEWRGGETIQLPPLSVVVLGADPL